MKTYENLWKFVAKSQKFVYASTVLQKWMETNMPELPIGSIFASAGILRAIMESESPGPEDSGHEFFVFKECGLWLEFYE